MRRFVIATQDHTGLGWAKILHDDGEDVTLATEPHPDDDCVDQFYQVGNGWLSTMAVDDAVAKFKKPDDYWIFDTNSLSDVSEHLRSDGRKVFGASEISERLEHDRAFAMETATSQGLDTPPMESFSDIADGLAFLDDHADTAYVFKPNDADASHLTFVPDHNDDTAANAELVSYLTHLTDGSTDYVLQERKHGIEVCFEVWLYDGEPFMATCTLENKRQLNGDLGEHGPCAHDVIWTLPLESEGVQLTAMKMASFLAPQHYTGCVDVNCLVDDTMIWFLEVGCRFGYNAHPNLFLTLADDTFGNIMADWIDGRVQNIASRFKRGFGASISVRLDHPRAGLPIAVSPEAWHRFYPYDGYKDGDQLLLTGYGCDVGIYTQYGSTIADAGKRCLGDVRDQHVISVPDIGYRTDIARTDYANAPIRRFDELSSLRLL